MNPEQNQQPQATPSQDMPTQPTTPSIVSKKSHRKLALLLLSGPTGLFILAFLLNLAANLLYGATPQNSTELFASSNAFTTILNLIGYLAGTIAFLTWLPGLIIGIILLNKK